jgi:hypothetical protein
MDAKVVIAAQQLLPRDPILELANDGRFRLSAWPPLLHKVGYFWYLDDLTIDGFLEALSTIPSLET